MNIKDKPKVNTERQYVEFYQEIDWPEGTPDEIIVYMMELKEDFKQVTDLKVEYRWMGYEDCEYYVQGSVLESDEQLTYRLRKEQEKVDKWEERYKKYVEKQEREVQLRAEFEKMKLELEQEGFI